MSHSGFIEYSCSHLCKNFKLVVFLTYQLAPERLLYCKVLPEKETLLCTWLYTKLEILLIGFLLMRSFFILEQQQLFLASLQAEFIDCLRYLVFNLLLSLLRNFMRYLYVKLRNILKRFYSLYSLMLHYFSLTSLQE